MQELIVIDRLLVEATSEKAKLSQRKRMNHNFHSTFDDPINRMLNALEPETYARPHKHDDPDKREVFIVLSGRLVAVIYNDDGEITDHILLDPLSGNFGVEIPPRVWHNVISLESGTVVYEVKNGPYAPLSDKDFAPWAPEEGSVYVAEYVSSILRKIGITL